MANLLSNAMWAKYRITQNDHMDTHGQALIKWVRGDGRIQHFNEQENYSGNIVELRGLIGYNSFRTWPITAKDQQGEVDNQNMLLYLSKDYLRDLGYLNEFGYFNFNPDLDYFIHMGIKYKSDGDTPVAQAFDDPVLLTVILRREETLNGNKQFEYSPNQDVIVEMQTQEIIFDYNDL